jgi:hypothetical protein
MPRNEGWIFIRTKKRRNTAAAAESGRMTPTATILGGEYESMIQVSHVDQELRATYHLKSQAMMWAVHE